MKIGTFYTHQHYNDANQYHVELHLDRQHKEYHAILYLGDHVESMSDGKTDPLHALRAVFQDFAFIAHKSIIEQYNKSG